MALTDHMGCQRWNPGGHVQGNLTHWAIAPTPTELILYKISWVGYLIPPDAVAQVPHSTNT